MIKKLKDLIHMGVIISQNKNKRDKKTFLKKNLYSQ